MVRTDLTLRQQIVQSVHAALEAAWAFPRPPGGPEVWLVVCALANEAELDAAARYLIERQIGFRVFYEPDGGLGNTAIATEPIEPKYRSLMRRFRLWSDT